MKKRLLVLGDSLSLPRSSPEFCVYEHTWPQLLKNHFDVHLVAIGGGTLSDLVRQSEYHAHYRPDFVVLQSGIVDCAPRSLSQLELSILNHFRLTRKILLPWIQKKAKTLRRIRAVRYTSKTKFTNDLSILKKKFPLASIHVIGILEASNGYENVVPGITKSVNDYNKLLSTVFPDSFISMSDMPREGIMSDFIHLNEAGHQFLYSKLIKQLMGHA